MPASRNENVPMAKALYVDEAIKVVPVAPSSIENEKTSKPLSENQIQQLVAQGYTRSLAESLTLSKDAFALRVWIIDNSGSMQFADGHKLIEKANGTKVIDCTRWEEIQECVEYHIRLAALIDAPTRFRFLNPPLANIGPAQFSIAESASKQPQDEARDNVNMLRKVRPGGCTPLTQHIMDIHKEVEGMAVDLRMKGQRVAITIATDGLPTDERGYCGDAYKNEFVESLRLLEGLPVWLVIRLCTDEDDVVEFYNGLDDLLELSIDVLDDFLGEAKEVYEHNPWLTYGLPLHRVREMGYHDRLFDLIDERALTAGEIRDFCVLLLGSDHFDGAPDPSADWAGFMKFVERALRATATQWNPVKNKAKPLVSVKKLNKRYGHAGCFW